MRGRVGVQLVGAVRRRGGVYVAVLGVSALVTVLGLGGLASARAIARTGMAAGDLPGARAAAHSALELARKSVSATPSWRTSKGDGVWYDDLAIGGALVDVEAANPNGAMDRMPTDPLELTATARLGGSTHTARMRLLAESTALDSLEAALAAGGAVSVTGGTVYADDTVLASNGAFTVLLSGVYADVESGLTATGLTVYGSTRSLAGTRAMPGSNAFDHYLRHGTMISATSLASRSGVRTLYNVLLSPTQNPVTGAANADGIYVINGGGSDVAVESCRIVGTLVVVNAGTVLVKGSVVAEPAASNFPCLMVRGDAKFAMESGALVESTANFNPAGCAYPYPNGLANATVADRYASAINGLVYVSGDAAFSGSNQVHQVIVGGNVTITGTLTMAYSSEYRRNPPPGFETVVMVPDAGGWKQEVR